MARTPVVKKLEATRLANQYGGWIYCESCGQNIGYLCYVTYDTVAFEYRCNCGSEGSMYIEFKHNTTMAPSSDAMVSIKNRLCCPKDESPLITILGKKLKEYRCTIGCTACNQTYVKERNA